MALSAEKAARRAAAAKKVKKHDQRGKDHPDVVAKADAIVKKVKAATAEDHALGKQIKELRDGGMAWWQIAYQLNLPGSGPNVAQGKSGAARARSLYKKTFGELPGDVAKRSTKASRAAGDGTGAPVVRKAIFDEATLNSNAEELLAKVVGKEIRWIGRTPCADGSVLEVEREARVHTTGASIQAAALPGGPVLHFREVEKGDRRAQQYRSVRLADIYDIRR